QYFMGLSQATSGKKPQAELSLRGANTHEGRTVVRGGEETSKDKSSNGRGLYWDTQSLGNVVAGVPVTDYSGLTTDGSGSYGWFKPTELGVRQQRGKEEAEVGLQIAEAPAAVEAPAPALVM